VQRASAEDGAGLCTDRSTDVLVAAQRLATPVPGSSEDGGHSIAGRRTALKSMPVHGLATPFNCRISTHDVGGPNTFGGIGGLSADGSTLVCFLDAGPNTPLHACTFSHAEGLVDLGTLDPSGGSVLSSLGFGASADGSVVVGAADVDASGTQHAFRWTRADGMLDLGSARGASGTSRAFAASGDGSALVGDSDFPSGQRRAFRWTQSDGFQDLDPSGFGAATAISTDGRTVVGQNKAHVLRWTQDGGLQDLLTLPGRSSATATGVSDNGKVIVGLSAPRSLSFRNSLGWDFGTSDTRALRWTPSNGMQDLSQLLADRGVDMTGITLVAALGVSTDGQFIAGALITAEIEPNQTIGFIAQVCDDAVDACLAPTPSGVNQQVASSGPR
jgi:probable HAF family extracellular repeat protein